MARKRATRPLREGERAATPGSPATRHGSLALGLMAGLAVLTVGVYFPVLEYPFVLWDDPRYVVRNPGVLDGLTLEKAAWAFTSTYAANWHPLTWLSHMLDVELFGLEPGGHHATSLLLHVANTLLLWGCLARPSGRPLPSAVVAGLFAIHPLHVESVAWVAERKDLLSTFFWLLSLHAWIGYSRSGGLRPYLTSLALAACALMAKPMAVTLPLTLLLFDYWPLGRLQLDARGGNLIPRVVEKLPFLLLAAISSIITLWAQGGGGAMDAIHAPFLARLANAWVVYALYLAKTVWPSGLAAFYIHPNAPGGSPWAAWQVVASVVLLTGFTVIAIRLRRPYLSMGWFWYLITLVPVIGVIQVGAQGWADRYTYVPLIGIFAALAWGGAELLDRFAPLSPGRRMAAASTLALALLLAFATASRAQLVHWRDSVSLFRRAIAVGSDSRTMHDNLGAALTRQGRPDEAIPHYLRAIELEPDDWRAYFNLGSVFLRRGQWRRAAELYQRSLRLDPDQWPTHQSLAIALQKLGRLDDARRHAQAAERLRREGE